MLPSHGLSPDPSLLSTGPTAVSSRAIPGILESPTLQPSFFSYPVSYQLLLELILSSYQTLILYIPLYISSLFYPYFIPGKFANVWDMLKILGHDCNRTIGICKFDNKVNFDNCCENAHDLMRPYGKCSVVATEKKQTIPGTVKY